MTSVEDRLRTELRAEAEQITPDGLAGLRLPEPGPARRPLTALRRGGTRRSPGWAKPLAAAAAVVTATVGTLAAVHAISARPPAASTPVSYASAPAYYAYTAFRPWPGQSGVNASGGDGYIKVRDTATGKLLATIASSSPYSYFGPLTADASGTMYIFGEGHADRSPLKLLLVRITAQGRVHVSGWTLPDSLTWAKYPSFALSPDGSKLAVAFGGRGQTAVVQVITLATGSVRQWTAPRAAWTPDIEGEDAWTADGRGLAFVEAGSRSRSDIRLGVFPPTLVRLLDTAAPGTSLTSARLLALHTPAGEPWRGPLFLTPDGTELIETVMTGMSVSHTIGHEAGEVAVYSARTGALLRTAARWVWRSSPRGLRVPEQVLAWSGRSGGQLILLQPGRYEYTLGVLAGNTFTRGGSMLRRLLPSGYRELRSALETVDTRLVW